MDIEIEKVKTILERIVRWHDEFPEAGGFNGNDTSRPITKLCGDVGRIRLITLL